MNTRHRIPSLFSLSMVDVLCCALGCVILLWLVNSREAKQRNEVAGKTKLLLEQTSQKLDSTTNQRDKTKTLLAETTNKYNSTLTNLEKSQSAFAKLQVDMADLLKKNKSLFAQLNLKEDDNKNLSEKVMLTAKQMAVLENILKQKNDDLKKEKVVTADLLEKLATSDALAKLLSGKLETSDKQMKNLSGKLENSGNQVQMLTGKLDASEKEMVKLLSQVDDAKKLNKQLDELLAQFKQDAKDFAVKLEKSESNSTVMTKQLDLKNKELEKSKTRIEDLIHELEEVARLKKVLEAQLALSQADLTKAQSTISGLTTEKIDLNKKADLFKSLWANRFEGIELTGKRVIFLVDISGSMRLLDSKTDAPGKWNEVCELLGKLMRNLPDLTHYQVIAFSDSVIYPLGYENKWLVYDPKTSPKYLLAKMKAITPKGGTDIYPAFAEAFKYKVGNLDTIYFISDGLPDPEKIPVSIQNLSKVEQTTYFCNQIRQQLKDVWNRPVNNQVPVRINTIGFFFESPDVGAFLWALARENNGNFVGMSKP